MKLDAAEIISGIRNNDDRVLAYVFQHYGPKVIGYVIKNSGSQEDGQEILQQTLLKVWKNIREDRYDDRGVFDSYFYRIAANSWREVLRSRKRKGTRALSEQEYQLSDNSTEEAELVFIRDQNNKAPHQAIKRLGAVCQELIEMFHFKEIPLKDIAERQDVAYGTLRKRVFDCRNRLKSLVEEELKLLLI